MKLTFENIFYITAEGWENGKQYFTYITTYLEETKWFVPLDDVMTQ